MTRFLLFLSLFCFIECSKFNVFTNREDGEVEYLSIKAEIDSDNERSTVINNPYGVKCIKESLGIGYSFGNYLDYTREDKKLRRYAIDFTVGYDSTKVFTYKTSFSQSGNIFIPGNRPNTTVQYAVIPLRRERNQLNINIFNVTLENDFIDSCLYEIDVNITHLRLINDEGNVLVENLNNTYEVKFQCSNEERGIPNTFINHSISYTLNSNEKLFLEVALQIQGFSSDYTNKQHIVFSHTPSDASFTVKEVNFMKEQGFKTIRLPVTWYSHMNSNGAIHPDWLNIVSKNVSQSVHKGFYVILSIRHDVGWIVADQNLFDEYEYAFRILVIQIAKYFQKYDHHLIFEFATGILNYNQTNEITEEEFEVVNKLNQIFVDEIRNTGYYNSHRYLIVCPYNSSHIHLDNFSLPQDSADQKLLVGITDFVRTNDKFLTALKYFNEDDKGKAMLSKHNIVLTEFGVLKGESTNNKIDFMSKNIYLGYSLNIPMIVWDDAKNYKLMNRPNHRWEQSSADVAIAMLNCTFPYNGNCGYFSHCTKAKPTGCVEYEGGCFSGISHTGFISTQNINTQHAYKNAVILGTNNTIHNATKYKIYKNGTISELWNFSVDDIISSLWISDEITLIGVGIYVSGFVKVILTDDTKNVQTIFSDKPENYYFGDHVSVNSNEKNSLILASSYGYTHNISTSSTIYEWIGVMEIYEITIPLNIKLNNKLLPHKKASWARFGQYAHTYLSETIISTGKFPENYEHYYMNSTSNGLEYNNIFTVSAFPCSISQNYIVCGYNESSFFAKLNKNDAKTDNHFTFKSSDLSHCKISNFNNINEWLRSEYHYNNLPHIIDSSELYVYFHFSDLKWKEINEMGGIIVMRTNGDLKEMMVASDPQSNDHLGSSISVTDHFVFASPKYDKTTPTLYFPKCSLMHEGYPISNGYCSTCEGSLCAIFKCDDGYFDDDGKCKICSIENPIPNSRCLECDRGTCFSYECNDGYFKEDDSCKPCTSRYPVSHGECTNCNEFNCLKANCINTYFDNGGMCSICSSKYNVPNGKCISCDDSKCLMINCGSEYFVNGLTCGACSNRHRIINGKCSKCDKSDCFIITCNNGHYQEKNKCKSCNMKFENSTHACYNCNDTNCTKFGTRENIFYTIDTNQTVEELLETVLKDIQDKTPDAVIGGYNITDNGIIITLVFENETYKEQFEDMIKELDNIHIYYSNSLLNSSSEQEFTKKYNTFAIIAPIVGVLILVLITILILVALVIIILVTLFLIKQGSKKVSPDILKVGIESPAEKSLEMQTINTGIESGDGEMQSINLGNQSINMGNQSINMEMQSINMGNQSINMEMQSINMGNQSINMEMQY